MLTRRKLFLYKVETVKGTDAVPTVADDLVLPNSDINIAIPTEQDSGEGELKGTFGPGDSVTVKQSMSLDLTSRVRGLGAGAGALLTPMQHAMIMASAHTVVTGGDGAATPRTAEYKPTSDATLIKSATGYFYEDGLLYKMLACQNGLAFEATMNALTVKGVPQGKYSAPTVVALPAFTAPTQKLYRMTNTLCAVTEGGGAINIGAFSFDAGVDVQELYETGNQEFVVINRNPTISIDPRAVATAAELLALTNATSVQIVATFTNELGETLVFTAPKCVPMEFAHGDRAGQIITQKKFSLKETAPDNQYTFKWTAVL